MGSAGIMQGATLYIFDRKEMNFIPASVINVSQQHVTKSAQTNPAAAMQGLVVDLTVSTGKNTTTIEFPVNATTANYPELGWFVSTDRNAVSREIEAMGNISKQALAQGPMHEKIARRCDELLLVAVPERQKEVQQAQMITALEAQVQRLEKQNADTSGKLDLILSRLSGGPLNNENKEEKQNGSTINP